MYGVDCGDLMIKMCQVPVIRHVTLVGWGDLGPGVDMQLFTVDSPQQ